MRKLSLILVLLHIICMQSLANPHGKELKISCDACHNSENWKVDQNKISFSHNSTQFLLEGIHQETTCISCHPSLVFEEARQDCTSCHSDVHEQSLGLNCSNCHTPKSWIVENITTLHQQSRFPLLGPHATADCYDCHLSASLLRFDPIGIECIDCHQEEYFLSTEPNHIESGFSTDCMECHKMNSYSWKGSSFTHAFFPLTLGHAINDCKDCHTSGTDYSTLTNDCFSCHQNDYNSTTNPNHLLADLPTECTECHTTNPGWKPAEFVLHDNVFPIYSGEHNGEWNNCTDCHTNTNNYSLFSCIDCHEHNQSDMADEHQGVGGYLYTSTSCFECHPTGSGEGGFNHSASNFPLTGAHSSTDCISCHSAGYSGTSSYCYDCHTADFNQTTSPNHGVLSLSHDCDDCHTSNPGWQPALFNIHSDYYPLNGAHTTADCSSCHTTGYSNTPNTCFGCHENDYNQTTDPPHLSAQFSINCLECHTELAWEPSTFDHDGQYFPIYSGEHNGEWNSCTECHTTASTYTLFSCFNCHSQTDMNEEHQGESGYSYNSLACLDCHPTGTADD